MKDKQFQELIESIGHAGEYMRGRRKGYRVFRYTFSDTIRRGR